MQAALPERITDYRYLLFLVIFLLREESTHDRRDLQGWKHSAREPDPIHLRRLANAGELVTILLVPAEILEAARIARVGLDVRSRDPGLPIYSHLCTLLNVGSCTSLSECGKGSGRSRSTPSTTEKMAIVAPIPSASISTAVDVKPGDFNKWRIAIRRSWKGICTGSLRDRVCE